MVTDGGGSNLHYSRYAKTVTIGIGNGGTTYRYYPPTWLCKSTVELIAVTSAILQCSAWNSWRRMQINQSRLFWAMSAEGKAQQW